MISEILLALTLIASALITGGILTFIHGKEKKKLRDELSKEKRKNFDMELKSINSNIDSIPIEDLVRDDEEIIKG